MRQRTLLAAVLLAASALQPGLAADPPVTPVPAGAWRTWVIPSGEAFRLPAPPDPEASRAELAELREMAERRDAAALARVAYWDAGAPSYRWNQVLTAEMLRGGTPANLAYRHLAVLHVVLYDALVAAWDSKQAFVRPHPAALDPGLRRAIPDPPSPSYPAEHAVAAGAAAVVLAQIYPQRAEAFRAMAEEAAASRLVPGVAFPSDVRAGLDLGRRVAEAVMERAATDGSTAPWTGRVPAGPGLWTGTNPVLPQAAGWRTWLLERPDALRPPPPAAHDSPERRAELEELRRYPRTPRTNAEAGFWEYAVGGLRQYQFWGGHLARLTLENRLDHDAPRAARAFALTYAAVSDAGVACWDAKFAYWAIRPSQLDPELRTVVPVPNHPSYPAAHACFSAAAATMLGFLFPAEAEAMAALARDAGESRIWAGIHFRSDVTVGAALGQAVAARAIERARADGS